MCNLYHKYYSLPNRMQLFNDGEDTITKSSLALLHSVVIQGSTELVVDSTALHSVMQIHA